MKTRSQSEVTTTSANNAAVSSMKMRSQSKVTTTSAKNAAVSSMKTRSQTKLTENETEVTMEATPQSSSAKKSPAIGLFHWVGHVAWE